MANIRFTANLQRHVAAPGQSVRASTVREAIEAVCANNPRLRGYILDDQGMVRRHISIYVNQTQIRDRQTLADAVTDEDEIFVMQALSGG